MPAIREVALAAALALLAASCDGGSGGGSAPPPRPPEPEDTSLTRFDDAPGVVVAITSVSGASGADGSFRPGDALAVRFRLEKSDGSRWGLAEMGESSALVSGPSFNYQRVIAERTDVVERAVAHADGSFTYRFAAPIPAVYLPPYNDTPSFGPLDGELAGEPLLAGTYTVGLSFVWTYTVEGQTFHDAGEAAADFRFGGAPALLHREVTRQDNCNQCHVSLRAHESKRRDVALCVLCHTSGAEDANHPALAGGTPGASIEMRVMVHKIHSGRHLPSVLGVGVDALGNVVHGLPPEPYLLADPATGVHDYSQVGFPVFPDRSAPMPRDFGHSALAPAARAAEDAVRSGVTRCAVCHGDPDGSGPLGEPAQGGLVLAQPTRRACGACHDDVDWSKSYFANQQEMPPQPDDSSCYQCHTPDGMGFYSPLAVEDAHLHPLLEPAYTGATFLDFTTFPGLELALLAAEEDGASNGDGDLDPGEKLRLTVTLETGSGAGFPIPKLAGLSAVLSGPTGNANLVHRAAIPKALLAGPQPYSFLLPEQVALERVGASTAALGDVFVTARAPHLALAAAPTAVRVRTGTAGGSSVTAASSRAPANFLDLADATGFDRDDFVVVDDGAAGEEYLQVQLVEGDRLWFSSPESSTYKASTARDHAAGATVREVQLATQPPGNYSLQPATGTITELVEFGAGNAVVVGYTTDFVMPASYPVASNGSPDLGETTGEWQGKSIAPGTYRVVVNAHAELDLNANAEDNLYTYSAPGASLELLVGPAPALEPYDRIDSGASCYACHQDLVYHGIYRGFESCIACHGNAGAEDRPRYVSANAPETAEVTTNFRTLLHAIHRGAELANASTFTVVGAGTAPYPDDFELNGYEPILFPAHPARTAQCAKCHGAANTAWIEPAPRDHPSEQGEPVLAWRFTCGACHDSAASLGHFALQTSGGVETCSICHGPGNPDAVEVVHKAR
jgi:hypothetical protein